MLTKHPKKTAHVALPKETPAFFCANCGAVSLEAEVARSVPDPEDGSRCYGARFPGLSSADADLLKRFVWAER